jgi:5'(3')-deoxyribonucleotidase
MAGEVLAELTMAALGDDPLESVGDKVEEVTKRFPFLRYAFLVLFCAGWGIYFLWFY